MAISDVKIVMSMDNSKVTGGLKEVQSVAKATANFLSGEVVNKLKYVFSVAAIEEATRRTGAWAQEIQQSAKAIGISAEALQTLQLLASKTGTPQDAVVGMFENIAKARDEALAGNKDLLISFQKLGVSLQDLRTKTKSGLFSQVMGAIPANVQNTDQMTRQSVAGITGTPENFINDIKASLGGKSFEQAQSEGVGNGTVLSNDSISELSATYTSVLENLKEAGRRLAPMAVLILGIVNLFLKALQSVEDLFGGLYDMVTGNFKSGFQKIGGVLLNATFGVAKVLTGIFDFITEKLLQLESFLHVPNAKNALKDFQANNATSWLTKQQEISNKALGISDSVSSHGEAAGEAATLFATPAGGAAIQGARTVASNAILKAASIAEKQGLTRTANALLEGASKIEVKAGEAGTGKAIVGSTGNILSSAITTAVIAKGAIPQSISHATNSAETTPILPRTGVFGEVKGGESSMLKFGGIFGSAFTSKMIALTQDMVRILGQIQSNTYGNQNNNGQGGVGPAGGI